MSAPPNAKTTEICISTKDTVKQRGISTDLIGIANKWYKVLLKK